MITTLKITQKGRCALMALSSKQFHMKFFQNCKKIISKSADALCMNIGQHLIYVKTNNICYKSFNKQRPLQ